MMCLRERVGLGLVLCVFLSLVLFGSAREARAQSANYSGVTSAVGSGFSSPFGVAVDASGDVFVADSAANNTGAVKEIVAVNGQVSSSSQVNTLGGGFSDPSGVAVDSSGDVFVADTGHGLVKEIPAGCLTSTCVTTLGGGFSGPQGVALDASGDVFVADTGNDAVKEIPAGCLTSACVVPLGGGFSGPQGVAVDGNGDVFVADTGHDAVKEIPASCISGTNDSTCVSPLGSGFSAPEGVAVDASGDVFVADTGSDAAKEIVAVSGQVSAASTVNTIGSGFSQPAGVAVDAGGDVFVGDYGNNAVKRVQFSAVNFGSVNVSSASSTVLVPFTFTAGGQLSGLSVLTQGATDKDFTEVAGSTTCSTTATYNSGDTCSVAVQFLPLHPGLRIGAVQLLSSSGAVIATAALKGIGVGPQVVFPSNSGSITLGKSLVGVVGLAVDSSGDVFFQNNNIGTVYELVAASNQLKTVLTGTYNVGGIAVDGSGDVFVSSSYTHKVYEVMAVNGQVSSSSTVNTVGSGFTSPAGLAVDGNGDVFVADPSSGVKEIVAVNGQVSATSHIKIVGSGFGAPSGVAVDGSGDVFVADISFSGSLANLNGAVKEIVAVNGQVSSTSQVKIVGGGFQYPHGVAVDASGDVFVADSNHNAVKEIPASCILGANDATCVETLGSGFFSPRSVAVDASGDVFVADTYNTEVKELPLATVPSHTFPTATAVGSTDTTDGPFTVTVANDGNATLTFPAPTTSGAYNPSISASFTFDSTSPSNCQQVSAGGSPNTLLPSASCSLAIEFAPVTSGVISGSAVLTDDSWNATSPSYITQTIRLAGVTTGTSLPGPPATIVASAGTPQYGYVNATFPVALQAAVADALGDPVPNVQVDFTAPTTGASATLSAPSCTTGANGTCSVTATANGTVGSYAVTAQAPAYSSLGTVSFLLTNQTTPNFVVNTAADDATGTAKNCESGSGTPCTLRDALALAKADGAGNITFDAGTFGSGATITLNSSSGPLWVYSNTTIQGLTSGSGATLTNLVTVDGNKSIQIFFVPGGVTGAAIDHLNIVNANTVNNGGGIGNNGALMVTGDTFSGNHAGSGGGIANYATLTVTDSTFSGNTVAGYGGGVATLNSNHTATITNSTFSGNSAGIYGGGAYTDNNTDTLKVINCKFDKNYAYWGGGGITNWGTTTVTGGTFSDNTTAHNGGGIDNNGTLTVSNGTFSVNKANSGSGGGIVNNGNSKLTVIVDTFSGNSAINGGGIADNGNSPNISTLTVTDSTFSGNSASNYGGGIVNLNGGNIAIVTNSTFSGNSAGQGGGFFNGGDTLKAFNSIFSGNTAGSGAGIRNYGTFTGSYNVISDSVVGTTLSSTNQTADPMLLPLGNYGGSMETMLPEPGSAAICAGSANLAANADLTADQRGVTMNLTAANASTYTGVGGYCPAGSIDAGAVQTDYALSFSTQPPSSVTVFTPFTAAVTLDENGMLFKAAAITIPLTLNASSGSLTGGSAATSNGVATYSGLSISAAGTDDTLTATLALNSALTPPLEATKTSQTFTVNAAATKTVLAASPNPSTYGQSVTLTATVTNTSAGSTGTPTGTVTFKDGSTSLGTATLNGSGVATLSTTALAGGSDSLTADFEGTTNYTASTSNTVAQTVNAAATKTGLTSSPNPSTFGQSVTLTATVTSTSGTPSGTVTFKDGSTSLGTGTLNGSGVATLTTATLAVGNHSLTADFEGTTNYTASTSNTITQTVKATTTTVLTSTPNPSAFGQSVTLTATVTPTSTSGTLSGTVTFKDGSTSLGTGTLNGSGVATFSTTALTAGSHSLTAVYGGNANYATSISNTVTQTVWSASGFIINVMDAQVTALGLNKGQTNSLLRELNQAAKMYNQGKINGAINNLEDFISEINDLESSGVVSPQEANLLIGEANSLIQLLRS